ncbi:Uncharacterised protein [Mycobacteroides abscessus subsp. abscessus]|nr:Uncharacterised protein [Mycobacteroides abscessus subsp. abscessus]
MIGDGEKMDSVADSPEPDDDSPKGLTGVAPQAHIVSVRQTSQAFNR